MRKIPTQILLDAPMYEALKLLAEKRKWSMSEIIRQALEKYLKEEGR